MILEPYLVYLLICVLNFQELKLRRSAITLIAFLASLGTTGFALMLNPILPERNSILACILQSLVSDVDFDALDSAPSSDVYRERYLHVLVYSLCNSAGLILTPPPPFFSHNRR